MEIKGYITNLGKYNEGELVGKWITFPIDEDDLNDVLKEIACCYEDENGDYINTGYEEYFFTDFDGDITDFGEFESIDKLNEYAEALEKWDADTFNAALEVFGLQNIDFDAPNDYILYPDIVSDYDLGYYWVEESGCYDTKALGTLGQYIDYEAFGRDIRFESYGGFSSYGWIISC